MRTIGYMLGMAAVVTAGVIGTNAVIKGIIAIRDKAKTTNGGN